MSQPLTPAQQRAAVQETGSIERPEALEERLALDGRGLRRHTARGALINTAFNAGLTFFGLGQRVAVAAFLTAAEFGFWGLLATTLLTLTFLKQVGISDKYIQQSDNDQVAAFQRAFTFELGYTLCFFVLIVGSLPVYAAIYSNSDIIVPGLVLSTALLFSALHTPIWVAYRQMRFARQRTLEATQPVVSTIVMVGMAATGFGYWSLVIGTVAGSAAAAVAAVATCPYPLALRFDRGVLRDYFSFSWPLFVARASTLAVAQGGIIVGNYTVGLAGLGALALATTFLTYVDRLDDIIRRTMYPAVCAIQERRELLFEAFVKSNRLALMWGVPFGLSLTLFAPDLISYVLGEKWRVAEGLLQAFGVILGLRQIAFNWSLFFNATGNTRPMAVHGALTVVVFFAVTVPLMFEMGLEGYAIGMAAVIAVQILVRGFYLRRLFERFNLVRHVIRALAPSVPAVGAVLALRLVPHDERTLTMALEELTVYVVLTLAATWILERRLVIEVVGYLRGPRPATT